MLLDYKNEIKLIGFQHAKKYDRTLGTKCGNLQFQAPEIHLGYKYSGQMCDVWALGVTLYTMLAGYLPFEAKSDAKLIKRVINGEFVLPKSWSHEAKDLLKRML
jgi:serine/threonine protein kinase